MAATIKDIARKLNISISTVSYALNGGPRSVPEEVKERVLAVAHELDYRPNALARSMAMRRTDTFAVVPPGSSEGMFCSPYLLTVLNGLCDAARERKQDILLHTASDEDDPETLVRMALSGKTDGVVLIAPHRASLLPGEIARRRFPCVLLGSEGSEGVLSIGIDNFAATRQALDHLVALGHRRIGHVTGRPRHQDGMQRLNAYRDYLAARELPLVPEWIVNGDFTQVSGYEAGKRLLDRSDRPSAILAGNDSSGIGVIKAAREMGLEVPRDLSVVGYDLLPQDMLGWSGLTSIRQPLQEMAARAIHLLMQWAIDGEPPAQRRYIFPTELVDRGSTAPPHPVAGDGILDATSSKE